MFLTGQHFRDGVNLHATNMAHHYDDVKLEHRAGVMFARVYHWQVTFFTLSLLYPLELRQNFGLHSTSEQLSFTILKEGVSP